MKNMVAGEDRTQENDEPSSDTESDNHEARGNCFGRVNRKRLVSKAFYLFYFSAFGSLWPYLALYFKQIFLSPKQLGIIVATRSLMQFVFTPVWGALADKFNKCKAVLLIGLASWIVAVFSIGLVPTTEKPVACYRFNAISLYQNVSTYGHLTRSTESEKHLAHTARWKETFNAIHRHHKSFYTYDRYLPWALFYKTYEQKTSALLMEASDQFPNFKLSSNSEHHVSDTSKLFLLILCITMLGITFSSPTTCLADTATLQLLGKDTHEYGKQALWGSVGYGVTAFVVGASLSTTKHFNPCSHQMDIYYVPCFYVFALLMFCAFIVATRFKYRKSDGSGCRPSVLDGLRILKQFNYAFFIFVVFFCGTSYGFIQTFLFWHLRELGGEQILFSSITLANYMAEVLFYTFSDKFLCSLGHFRVIYLGLLCYSLRFFYYSYCNTPWLFLPIEFIQGLTGAAVWSSFVSHVGATPGIATTLQGLVNGFYTGLGYATGGLMGGVMVHKLGTSTTFFVFGEMSLIVLFSYIIVNNFHGASKESRVQYKTLNKADTFESCEP